MPTTSIEISSSFDSFESCEDFKNESIDSISVNMNCSYGHLYMGLKAWYPKLRRGGNIIANNCTAKVTQALADFAQEKGIELKGDENRAIIRKPNPSPVLSDEELYAIYGGD